MHPSRILVALALPVLPVAALAADYHCTFGDMTRRVEIVTEPGRAVPCEVHYYKDSEAPGTREVLWSAQNEAGYCESRTDEFVTRLREWGWDCTTADATDDMPDETGDADDTETLAPAEDTG